MSHSTGRSSWRNPVSLNAANSSKPALPLTPTCTSMHIVLLASLRWAVSLSVKRQHRLRRSSVIAVLQPTTVIQPNTFPRAPPAPYDHDTCWAGFSDSVMENLPQPLSRWIRPGDNKWSKRRLIPTMAKWLWLIAELCLALRLLERCP